LSISRNAIAVFGGILLAYLFHIYGKETFIIVGEVESGFPSISLPPFSTTFEGVEYGFVDMLKALGLSLFSIPLVSIIEAVAIAKSFTRGKVLDVTQVNFYFEFLNRPKV
jgi:sodium-independent sulfate anion transporter 11